MLARLKSHSYALVSLAFLGLFILLGLNFVYQDLNAFLSQRSDFLRQNAVALSQLIESEQIKEAQNSKELGHSGSQALKQRLLELRADLGLEAEISIIEQRNDQGFVLASTSPNFTHGKAIETKLNLSSQRDSIASELQRSGELFELSALARLQDGSFVYLKSDATAAYYRFLSLGLQYVLAVLLSGGFVLVLLTYLNRKRKIDWQEMKDFSAKVLNDLPFPSVRLTRNLNIQAINVAASKVFEIAEQDCIGKNFFESPLALKIIPLDQDFSKLQQKIQKPEDFRFKIKVLGPNNEVLYFEAHCLLSGSISIVFHPIHQKSLAVRDQGMDLDPITKLPRADQINTEWISRYPAETSLVFIDIDDFLYLEHLNGKPEAQRLLFLFAQKLREFFRASDEVFHYENDRFLLFVKDSSPQLAARLVQNFQNSLKEEKESLLAGVLFSAGIARAKATDTERSWLERAELSLKAVKAAGKANIDIAN